MSYRTLKIGDVEYKYTIGKKNTKIIGVGIYKNSDIGNPVGYPSYQDNTFIHTADKLYIVTPKIVRDVILGNPLERKQLMVNPYAAEIRDEIQYLDFNAEHYRNLQQEI